MGREANLKSLMGRKAKLKSVGSTLPGSLIVFNPFQGAKGHSISTVCSPIDSTPVTGQGRWLLANVKRAGPDGGLVDPKDKDVNALSSRMSEYCFVR